MTLIKFVKKKDVNRLALRLIKESKKTLHLTMLLSEEISNQYPNGYLDLLQKKALQGVIIRRIGFGSAKDYQIACDQLKRTLSYKNVSFKLCSDIAVAKRMLITDKHKMIFAIYKNNGKKVFYTEYQSLVNAFLKYFDELFARL